MFELMLTGERGVWRLEEEELGEIGRYASPAEAIQALQAHPELSAYSGAVLVLGPDGEWDEIQLEECRFN
jgi:hypothetical protein